MGQFQATPKIYILCHWLRQLQSDSWYHPPARVCDHRPEVGRVMYRSPVCGYVKSPAPSDGLRYSTSGR